MVFPNRLNTVLVVMLLLPVVSTAIQDGENVTFQTGSEEGEAVSQLLLSLKTIVFYGFKALLGIFLNLVSNCWTVSSILISISVFADSHNWIFNILLSLILVVATVMIANENRAIRKSQTEPNIAVDIQQKSEFHQLIYLGIQNIGLGPAYEITFNL